MKICAAQLLLASIPLSRPYVLSFCRVNQIDSIIIRLIVEDGEIGVAEAVPLPGYSHETTESILTDLQKILPSLVNMDSEEVEPYLEDQLSDSSFAICAVLTAKEFALREFSFPDRLDIPLVAPVSSNRNYDDVIKTAHHLYDHGYRTIKLKVGRDVEHDRVCASLLMDEMPDDTRIRIDANQAYDFKQACRFLSALRHERNYLVECLEQPFGIDAWQEFRRFAVYSQHVVPLMLDESIISETDVEKAAEAGTDLIKLKLFKHRGIKGLLALAAKAKDLGLKIIFGNGVASEIGNLAEAVAFQREDFFAGAFEGNGFSKLSRHVIFNPPEEIGGNLRWKKNVDKRGPVELDRNSIEVIQEVGQRA